MIQIFSINQLNNSFADREAVYQSLSSIYDLQNVAANNGTLLTNYNKNMSGVLVHTCNRIEYYHGIGYVSEDIARHLFRVVSGLESSLIGEIAIQGQIKTAYGDACEKYKLDKGMHLLFQTSLSVGKRVRTESGISRGAVSHSQAAAELIIKHFPVLNNTLISLIGAHKLNEDIIRFLKNKGAENILIANRSYEKAEVLARNHNCEIMRFDKLNNLLSFSDILITATSAPHLIVKYEQFPKNRKMLILDLAFPRDVDERIGALPGVTLYNLENIESLVNQNIARRKVNVAIAEKIIEEEVLLFIEKQRRQRNYVPVMAK